MGKEHAGYVSQIIKSDFRSRGTVVSEQFDLNGMTCLIIEVSGTEAVMVQIFPVNQVVVDAPKQNKKTKPRWEDR